MSIAEKDPVYIVCAIQDMVLGMTASVFKCIDFGYERAIKDKQDELKNDKKEFAEKCANAKKDKASSVTSFESLKADYDKKKQETDDFVADATILRNKLNLSALYIDMGIKSIVNNFMALYGVAAADTPTFHLKGSGDVVLKTDKTKKLYVTQQEIGASPVGAVHEVIDTVRFGVNAGKALTDITLAATKLGYKSKKLADDRKAAAEKKADSDPYKDEEQTHAYNLQAIDGVSKV
jgi:hypothetical protein